MLNPYDPPAFIDKDHIQRNIGVPHPHRDIFGLFIDKQHAVIIGKAAPKHETMGLQLRRIGYLDLNSVPSACCLQVQRVFLGKFQAIANRRPCERYNKAHKQKQGHETDPAIKAGIYYCFLTNGGLGILILMNHPA